MRTENSSPPTVLSFSGIDGAGKTTQIEALTNRLIKAGCIVQTLSFWDDVAVLRRFREFISHAVFRGEKGVGTQSRPVNRRDKNVSFPAAAVLRSSFYFFDAIRLRFMVRQLRATAADVVIFDRYLYDELANLPFRWPLARTYVRFLLKIVPKPDVPYLIDADPQAARLRKPEYPLPFLETNRAAYLTLSELVGMAVIEPRSIESANEKILEIAERELPQLAHASLR